MELRGVLPPWVLDRLYGVLETAQGGELQVLRALGIIKDSSEIFLDIAPSWDALLGAALNANVHLHEPAIAAALLRGSSGAQR